MLMPAACDFSKMICVDAVPVHLAAMLARMRQVFCVQFLDRCVIDG